MLIQLTFSIHLILRKNKLTANVVLNGNLSIVLLVKNLVKYRISHFSRHN